MVSSLTTLYSVKIGFFSFHLFLNFPFLGNVIISALPPVPTRGLTIGDVDNLMQQVRESMLDEFERMSKEVKSDLLPSYSHTTLKAN